MCGSDTIIFGENDRFGLSRLDHRLFPELGTSEVEPGCVLTSSAISASNSESLGSPCGLLRSTNEWLFSTTKKTPCGQYSREGFFSQSKKANSAPTCH